MRIQDQKSGILPTISSFLICFQDAVVVMASIGMTLMICATVVLRYFFKTDLYAIDEIETICAFWLYFIGAAYASYSKKQITADIVTFVVKKFSLRKKILIISSLATFVVCCIFTKFSVDLWVFAMERAQKTAVRQIPMVYMYSAIVIGFVLMCFFCLRDFLNNIKMSNGV